jgi:hypothetical protein
LEFYNTAVPGPLTGTVDLSAGELDFSVAALVLTGSAGTISFSDLQIVGTGLAASPDGALTRLDSGQAVQLTGEVGGAAFAALTVGVSGNCNAVGGCNFTLGDFEIPNAVPGSGDLEPRAGYFFGGVIETWAADPVIPEPASALLFAVGACIVGAAIRKREGA